MAYGHIYVETGQNVVIKEIETFLSQKGFKRFAMTKGIHPTQMKEINEAKMRLYWVSPRINNWTGIFEFRFYNNDERQRWGLTDPELAKTLSSELKTRVYQIEVVEAMGFWYYNLFDSGTEKESNMYQGDRHSGDAEKRYLLNRIIEKECLANLSIGYENIPGEMVAPVGDVKQSSKGIIGCERFRHMAFQKA